MNKNEALRMFFLKHADQLTEEWYESIEDNDPESVYASTHPEVISVLKGQNNEFHLYIEVEEDDELYTGNDLALRVVYIKSEDNTSIAQTHFYEVSTNKVLDFDLEEEEEEAVKEFCGKHVPSEEGINNEE
ncbi:DUF6509 family protein [Priestia megaterium]|uniref:DUF6509 family protein n=1 Tax=Priestia megaterium TaxID=1404 RepID=UPI003008E9A3